MTSLRTRTLLAAGLLVSAAAGVRGARAADVRSDAGFPVRLVELAGDPGRPGTLAHVKFSRELGFNALWVSSGEAGAWTRERAPEGPRLDPNFLRLARWCRKHGMELWVSINPMADTGERFVFSDPDGGRRLLAFVTLLRKKAGVRRIVLSFDGQPTELREPSDVSRYGASAAPAHLDLARRVASLLPQGVALWLYASTSCDAHLGDGTGPYAKAFLAGLPAIPPTIGIVWTGPTVVSPAISRADLAATRARLGGRRLLLYDNFPVKDDGEDDAMALILGALRGRDAGIRDVVAAYLACPARLVAGSRLSLFTTAEFLRDPAGYDPDAAAARAIARLAGPDREAQTALETQQLEWGGVIAGRNYWPRDVLNPAIAASRLNDPAFVDSFTWTAERYPGRMAALAQVADTAFRDDLLLMMRRRLAIARAMPLTIDYLLRVRGGRPDAAPALSRIDEERRLWDGDPDARRVLELFLRAAMIPPGETMR